MSKPTDVCESCKRQWDRASPDARQKIRAHIAMLLKRAPPNGAVCEVCGDLKETFIDLSGY